MHYNVATLMETSNIFYVHINLKCQLLSCIFAHRSDEINKIHLIGNLTRFFGSPSFYDFLYRIIVLKSFLLTLT